MPHPEGPFSSCFQTGQDRLEVLISLDEGNCLDAWKLNQCVACGKEVESAEGKQYTIKRGNDRHIVCFCKDCHAVFDGERNRPNRNPKAGRLVKGVVNTLGAIGMVVMMVVFAATMFALKSIMATKLGQEGDVGGMGEMPTFESNEPSFSFPRTFIDEEAGEPMLGDFSPVDLSGYEVSDEAGQVFQSDVLVDELYSEDFSFSDGAPSFAEKEF
jgi:hypothetical protein